MIEEVVENIIQAEKNAENIVKESQTKAKDMVAKAKDVAVAMFDDEKKRVESELSAMTNKAIMEAEEKSKAAINECVKQSEDMAAKAKAHVNEATDYIIGRIISKYDK